MINVNWISSRTRTYDSTWIESRDIGEALEFAKVVLLWKLQDLVNGILCDYKGSYSRKIKDHTKFMNMSKMTFYRFQVYLTGPL